MTVLRILWLLSQCTVNYWWHKWITVVYFEQSSAKGDYCVYSMSSHTVDHCRFQVNSQWSTAKSRVVLGTTVTPITVYSKPLVQYGCRVV